MQVLKFYNLEGQSKWLNLLYETCFLFLFLVLAWWATHSPLRSTSRGPCFTCASPAPCMAEHQHMQLCHRYGALCT